MLALESRFLYDAAGLAAGLDGLADPTPVETEPAPEPAVAATPTTAPTGDVDPVSGPDEIVFIDPAVKDYQTLVQGVSPDAEIVVLEAGQDGVAQISRALAARQDLDAIHIVGHGTPGTLFIGNARLTADNLDAYQGDLAAWGLALEPAGDILLYGCNIGTGPEGEAFVQAMAQATEADVAASDDDTGNAALGGDWDLEYGSGPIESDLAFDDATRDEYHHLLDPVTINFNNTPGGILYDPFTMDGFRFSVSGGSLGSRPYMRNAGFVFDQLGEAWDASLEAGTSAPHQNVTVSITRDGGGDFNFLSVYVGALGSGYNATVQGYNDGGLVFSETAPRGTGTTVTDTGGDPTGTRIDELRIVGRTDASWSFGFALDDFTYEVMDFAPDVGNLNNDTVTFDQSGSPVALDQDGNATVTDSDSPNFDGGRVRATITANEWVGQDVLLVGNTGAITVAGTAVNHSDGVQIGTITENGQGGNDLVISLNANANAARVQDLVRALQYDNTNNVNPDLEERTIAVTVEDGGGAPPPSNFITVNIEPTPLPAGTQVVTFGSTDLTGRPTTFTEEGFQFTVSGGLPGAQIGFDRDFSTGPHTPGIRTGDIQPNSPLTITIDRVDGVDFDMHSMILANHDDNQALTIQWYRDGSLVGSNSLEAGATQRVMFNGDTVDQIRISGVTSPSNSLMASFDDFAVGSVQQLPAITDLDGDSAAYTMGDPPLPLDQGTLAAVTDLDTPALDGGNLAVVISAGGDATEDVLGIDTSGAVSIGGDGSVSVGNVVSVSGVAVAEITSDGQSGNALVLSFNQAAGNATLGRVTSLVQAVTYLNTDTVTATAGGRTISFTVHDGDAGVSAPADVTVQVVGQNQAPVNTLPGAQSINEDATLAFSAANGNLIAVSDPDAFGGNLQTTLSVANGTLTVGGASGAVVTNNGTGSVTITGTIAQINGELDGLAYQGNLNFNGSDTLTIATSDQGNTGLGGTLTDTDTVAITINAVNDAPVNAVPPAQTVNEETALVFSAGNGNLISIADLDTGSGNVQTTLSVTNGTLTVGGASGATVTNNDTGSVTITGTIAQINGELDGLAYQGNLNFNGSDTLTIATSDQGNTGLGGTLTDTDTVAITVNGVNDAPVNTVPAAQAITEDTPLVFSTGNGNLISITDLDAGGGNVQTTLSVANGTLTVGGASGATVINNGTGTITITGTVAQINSELDGLSYQGNLNFNGSDTLAIATSDQGNSGLGGALIDADTVAITVNPSNDPVTAMDDGGAGFTTNAETPLTTGNVLVNDTDPDVGDSLAVTGLDTTGTIGLVTDNGDGTFSYDPNGMFGHLAAGATATDTFSYTVSDGNGSTDTATVTITVGGANVAPTAIDDAYATDEDTAVVTGNVLANDTDPNPLDTLAVTGLDTTGAIGSVIDNGDGTFTYDPAGRFDNLGAGQTATDTFTYTVADNYGGTDTATVTITVSGANDAPTANDDSFVAGPDGAATIGSALSNDTDPDAGDTLTVSSLDTTGTIGIVTNNGDGTFTYDPNGQFDDLEIGQTATDTFRYTVTDSNGQTDTATVTIMISAPWVGENPQLPDLSRPANVAPAGSGYVAGSSGVIGNMLDTATASWDDKVDAGSGSITPSLLEERLLPGDSSSSDATSPQIHEAQDPAETNPQDDVRKLLLPKEKTTEEDQPDGNDATGTRPDAANQQSQLPAFTAQVMAQAGRFDAQRLSLMEAARQLADQDHDTKP